MILDDDTPDPRRDDDAEAELVEGEWLDGLRSLGLPVRAVAARHLPTATASSTTVADLVNDSWAASTRASYEASWLRFCAWCYAHGLDDPLAASAGDVAHWVAFHVDAGYSAAYLARQLAAVTHAFDLAERIAPTRHPLVRRAVAGARRRVGTAQRQAIPLRLDELRRIMHAMAIVTGRKTTDPVVRRDRALLALGWSAALRAGSLVNVNVEDLTFVGAETAAHGGLLVHLRTSKTDQESKGADIAVPWSAREASCPVRAVMALARQQRSGPLFRMIDRHGRQQGRLSADAVSMIVQRNVQACLQLDPSGYSGHSLRAGFVSELRARNVAAHKIMRQTGHRDMRMLDVYDRPTDLFNEPVLAGEWW